MVVIVLTLGEEHDSEPTTVLRIPSGGQVTEVCPCLPIMYCPRIYGESPEVSIDSFAKI